MTAKDNIQYKKSSRRKPYFSLMQLFLVGIVLLLTFFSATPGNVLAADYDYQLQDVMSGGVAGLNAQVHGSGGSYYGDSLRVLFENNTGQILRIKIPIGLRLAPENTAVQTMVTAGGEILIVPPGQSDHVFKAFCGQEHDSAPSSSDTFHPDGFVDSELKKTLVNINKSSTYDRDAQDAVWHNTDGRDISDNERAQNLTGGKAPGDGAAAGTAALVSALILLWGLTNGTGPGSGFKEFLTSLLGGISKRGGAGIKTEFKPASADGYDENGYDREGYNRDGYNRAGFNQAGFDSSGYNAEGYDQHGFNRDGVNKDGETKKEVLEHLKNNQKINEKYSKKKSSWSGWITNFSAEVGENFVKSVTEEIPGAIGKIFDATKNIFKAGSKKIMEKDTWKEIGEGVWDTGSEIVTHPIDSTGKVLNFFWNIAKGIWNDPIGFVKTILGIDNWGKVIDPDVPLEERLLRALYGAVDTTLNIAAGKAVYAKVADKIGDISNVGKTLVKEGADEMLEAGTRTGGSKVLEEGAEQAGKQGGRVIRESIDDAGKQIGKQVAGSSDEAAGVAKSADAAGDAGKSGAAAQSSGGTKSTSAGSSSSSSGAAAGGGSQADDGAKAAASGGGQADEGAKAAGSSAQSGAASVAAPAENIMGVTKGEAALIRKELPRIPGVKHSAAFGSRVTGAARATSDVDIMVVLDGEVDVFKPEVRKILDGIEDTLSKALKKEVNIMPVTEKRYLKDWIGKVPMKAIK